MIRSLANGDTIIEKTFRIGVFPGFETAQLDYVNECLMNYARHDRRVKIAAE